MHRKSDGNGSAMRPITPIRTERLILREFAPEDWMAIHAFASDPQAVQYVSFGPNTVGESKTFVREQLEAQEAVERTSYVLAVTLAESRRLIGEVGLRLADRDEASLGYVFGRPFWGRGYGTEAARAMLGFAFDTLGLRRVTAGCDQRNIASARVLEKIGMRREGAHRQALRVREEWRDTFTYAILDWEWCLARGETDGAGVRGRVGGVRGS